MSVSLLNEQDTLAFEWVWAAPEMLRRGFVLFLPPLATGFFAIVAPSLATLFHPA